MDEYELAEAALRAALEPDFEQHELIILAGCLAFTISQFSQLYGRDHFHDDRSPHRNSLKVYIF